MTHDLPQTHLAPIRAVLQRLESYQWPAEARTLFQDAFRELDRLNTYLDASAQDARLAALCRVSLSMGASLDLNEVLTQVMDAVIELTGAERGFLMLIDPLTGEYELRTARNMGRETLNRKDMEISRTVVRTVIESGQGVLTTDAQNDPRFSDQSSVVMHALHSILCAPLRAHGKIIGVIYVDNRAQTGLFSDHDLDLLNTFASQAAIAIENARLYTQTDQALTARVAELETITQIDRQLNAHLELPRVLEAAHSWAMKETGASQAWFLLAEEDVLNLTLVAGPKETFPLSLQEPVVRQCLKEVSPQYLPPRQGTPARLLAAMLYSGKAVGLIVLERPEPFSRAAIAFIDRLASRAASAIQNARLYQQVQEANLAKTRFVSVVTHELRLPMTSIKGYTDLLRQGAVGPVNDMQLNFLDVIRNNVERMSVLVSDLSDISRIESGRLALKLEMVSVADCVQETITALQPRLDERQQTLEVDIPTGLASIYADRQRVVQVLNNLVSNAHKYTPDGGQITIRALPENGFVRVEVTDTGFGIAPDDQAKLFTQFFRSEDPQVREQQGWGLGLSVAYHLVELMNGRMGFHSVLKEGSTFWFVLPTSAPETPPPSEGA